MVFGWSAKLERFWRIAVACGGKVGEVARRLELFRQASEQAVSAVATLTTWSFAGP